MAPTSQQGFISMLWLALRPLFARHTDCCSQLRIFANWRGPPLSATGVCSNFRTPFQSRLIDPFCRWTVAGSALCFGKEGPTPQFVCASHWRLCSAAQNKEGLSYVVRSTVSCVWPKQVATEEGSSNWTRMQPFSPTPFPHRLLTRSVPRKCTRGVTSRRSWAIRLKHI